MENTEWLTKELKEKVRKKFEPLFKRVLTEEEVEEIATNLSNFTKVMIDFVKRTTAEQETKD